MRKKTSKLILMILSVLVAGGLMAQETASSFTLDEAQQYAMQNSYVLQNTGLDITKAQKKVWETITIGLPQVSGSLDYTKNISAAKQPFPVAIIPKEFWPYVGIPDDTPPDGTYPISFMQKYNSNYGFTVNQLLFDGSYIVGVGSSQVYLNLSKQMHEKTAIDIRDAVAQAYYLVLIGKESKKVMQENLENTQRLYNETKAYYENGFREEQDVDQMRLMVKNAENEILKAEREIDISKVVLKFAMGYPVNVEINLNNELNDFLMPIVGKNEAGDFDPTSHISYKLTETNYIVSQKLLKLEKASYLPKINLFYNWNNSSFSDESNVFKSSVPWFSSSMIGFNLSVPIFNSGQKMLKVQQAKIDLEKSRNEKDLVSQTLQKDFLTAVASMESNLEKYENDKESMELSVKILDKAKIKFNNGITSSTELSQLESQYLQTHGAYIGSMLQLLQSDLALKKAMGKL